MTIELTNDEIKLIDKALVGWQNEPASGGLMLSMLGAMLGREKSEEGTRKSIKDQQERTQEEIRKRELTVMRLRLKLNEVKERSGEFTTLPA